MDIICKNCGQSYTGHYCSNCGQPAATHKLNSHFLWQEIRRSLFHFDVGILYSVKQLFTRPGHSIREFIEGKRVRHFKPVSLVLLMATLYGFLYHYFNINFSESASGKGVDSVEFNNWMGSHYAWVTLLTIPLYSIGTNIAFKKQPYNLVEYFILNTYIASQRLIVHIALFPLLYFFNGTSTMRTISLIIYLIDTVFIFWVNGQFFNNLSLKRTFLLTILSQLIYLIGLILTILIFKFIYEIILT